MLVNPNNRIHQYLDEDDGYKGWINTVCLYFAYGYERPIAFTPLIRLNCRQMFNQGLLPMQAAHWIGAVYGLNDPFLPHNEVSGEDDHDSYNS